jgi:hypothetical protein
MLLTRPDDLSVSFPNLVPEIMLKTKKGFQSLPMSKMRSVLPKVILMASLLLLAAHVVAAASITSLSPSSGRAGASVTIKGSNFGAVQGTSTVKFNGVAAAVVSWSATSIVTKVPEGATTGEVVVTVLGEASTGKNFTVVPTH